MIRSLLFKHDANDASVGLGRRYPQVAGLGAGPTANQCDRVSMSIIPATPTQDLTAALKAIGFDEITVGLQNPQDSSYAVAATWTGASFFTLTGHIVTPTGTINVTSAVVTGTSTTGPCASIVIHLNTCEGFSMAIDTPIPNAQISDAFKEHGLETSSVTILGTGYNVVGVNNSGQVFAPPANFIDTSLGLITVTGFQSLGPRTTTAGPCGPIQHGPPVTLGRCDSFTMLVRPQAGVDPKTAFPPSFSVKVNAVPIITGEIVVTGVYNSSAPLTIAPGTVFFGMQVVSIKVGAKDSACVSATGGITGTGPGTTTAAAPSSSTGTVVAVVAGVAALGAIAYVATRPAKRGRRQ